MRSTIEDSWEGVPHANLGNDHGFISKEYISIGMRPSGEAQSKATRVVRIVGREFHIGIRAMPLEESSTLAQSGQYHSVVESSDF